MWSRARESAARLCMCAVTETKGYFCQVYEGSVFATESQRSRGQHSKAKHGGITKENLNDSGLLLLLLLEDTPLK